MSIPDNIRYFNNELPPDINLVAVSKYHPVEDILAAYGAGQRLFGESRPQELRLKAETLSAKGIDDVQWHFIGRLQSNKIRMTVPYASLIHSVDSLPLLERIDSSARSYGKVQDVLLEVHIASETAKQGFPPDQVIEAVQGINSMRLSNVRVRGLMGMASFTDDTLQVDREFKLLYSLFSSIRGMSLCDSFDILSMGMTNDWRTAIKNGATHIRVGTAIFGERSFVR